MVLLLYALSCALVDITNYVLVLFKTHFSSTLKNGLDLLSAVNTVTSSSSSLMLFALGMHCPGPRHSEQISLFSLSYLTSLHGFTFCDSMIAALCFYETELKKTATGYHMT